MNRSHETVGVTHWRQPRVSVSKISERTVKVATHPQACRSTRPCCSPGRCTPAWSPRSREASATSRRSYRTARCHDNDLSITGQNRSRFNALFQQHQKRNTTRTSAECLNVQNADSAIMLFLFFCTKYVICSYFNKSYAVSTVNQSKGSAQSGLVS